MCNWKNNYYLTVAQKTHNIASVGLKAQQGTGVKNKK